MYRHAKITALVHLILLLLLSASQAAVTAPAVTDRMTLKVIDKPLSKLVTEIKKQTGYHLEVNDELSSKLVTGNYKSVSIENFLKRVYKNKNVFVIIDEPRKIVTVRQVGGSNKKYSASSVFTGTDTVFGTNMTMTELDDISTRNARLYTVSKSDPNEKIFGADLTKAELDVVGEMSKNNYENDNHDQSSNVHGTSLKKKYIKKIGESSAVVYNINKNNPNTIILGTNLTIAEIDVSVSSN